MSQQQDSKDSDNVDKYLKIIEQNLGKITIQEHDKEKYQEILNALKNIKSISNCDCNYNNKDKIDSKLSTSVGNDEIKEERVNDFDCIVLIAGGLDDDGNVHPWVKNRLDLGIKLYKNNVYTITTNNNDKSSSEEKEKVCSFICTGGGTYYKSPILDKNNFVIHESTAMTKYLIDCGKGCNIDSKNIYREWSSYDTIGSLYFTIITLIIPKNFINICIITSKFHMGRVKLLFNWIWNLHKNNDDFKCQFICCDDANIDKNIILLKSEHEIKRIESMKQLIEKINTKEKFHDWLFHKHKAYSSSFLDTSNRNTISHQLKKTY